VTGVTEASRAPHLPPEAEFDLRMRAAGMIWDEERQDWTPDPAVWGEQA
jgi:hypothetical protein